MIVLPVTPTTLTYTIGGVSDGPAVSISVEGILDLLVLQYTDEPDWPRVRDASSVVLVSET